MERYEYFVMLAGCLGSVAVAAWFYGIRQNIVTHWKVFVGSIGITFVLFCVWDYFAILRAHWDFNARYVTNIRILNIPIEELAFFLIIPIASLLTWEIICKVIRRKIT